MVSIALLWPLQRVDEICVLIDPAPPGCGAPEPRIATITAIAIIIATFAAMVVVTFTVQRPRRTRAVLAGAILVVALLAATIVALSQTEIWDPYSPPIVVN